MFCSWLQLIHSWKSKISWKSCFITLYFSFMAHLYVHINSPVFWLCLLCSAHESAARLCGGVWWKPWAVVWGGGWFQRAGAEVSRDQLPDQHPRWDPGGSAPARQPWAEEDWITGPHDWSKPSALCWGRGSADPQGLSGHSYAGGALQQAQSRKNAQPITRAAATGTVYNVQKNPGWRAA